MEETLPSKTESTGKEKRLDPVGIRTYGERFTGYQKIEVYKDLLPAFKDFYYTKKTENPNAFLYDILQGFNAEVCEPLGRTFFPYPTQVKSWRAKWDLDIKAIVLKAKDESMQIIPRTTPDQIIKTRGEGNELMLGAPSDSDLEMGTRTLAGELLNDAMQMLKDDQEIGEVYDDEVLIKRRSYIVNVFAHATRLVHGKAALMLKASQEKRENAGFLMSLLSKATAGTLSEEQMSVLETAYPAKQNEPAAQH